MAPKRTALIFLTLHFPIPPSPSTQMPRHKTSCCPPGFCVPILIDKVFFRLTFLFCSLSRPNSCFLIFAFIFICFFLEFSLFFVCLFYFFLFFRTLSRNAIFALPLDIIWQLSHFCLLFSLIFVALVLFVFFFFLKNFALNI